MCKFKVFIIQHSLAYYIIIGPRKKGMRSSRGCILGQRIPSFYILFVLNYVDNDIRNPCECMVIVEYVHILTSNFVVPTEQLTRQWMKNS